MRSLKAALAALALFVSAIPIALAQAPPVTITCGNPGVLCGTAAVPLVTTPSSSGTTNTNITQFGSNPVVTGTGVSGSGIPRFTVSSDSSLTANAGTNLNTSLLAVESGGNLAQSVTDFGAPGATACATDTGSCNFNQLFQRIAQRLTTVNTTLGSPIQATGGTVGLVAGTALVGNVGVAQASTTSGQSGPLAQGAVTTSAPTYVTAQTSPLSLDTAGNLRVGGGLAQSVATAGQLGSLVMGAVTTSAPSYSTGNTSPLSMDAAGNLRVVFAADAVGGATYSHVAAGQATTTVKSGAGTLYAITLNSAATATNTTTIYDNTAGSGTVILIPAVTTATVPTTLTFGPAGIAFATGLTVVTAAANGGDMTFVYK